MIISLAGRSGVGKDLVAQIIQILTLGKETGKEFSMRHIAEALSSKKIMLAVEETTPWHIKKFAFRLKQMAALICNVPVENFESQLFKASFMPKEWGYWAVTYINIADSALVNRFTGFTSKEQAEKFIPNGYGKTPLGMEKVVGWHQMTYRQLLEDMGQKMKDVHIDFWINSLFSEYVRSPHNGPTRDLKYPLWIISDTRYPEEADIVSRKGGFNIKITRDTGREAFNSERFLDQMRTKYTINNNGSIEDLVISVRQILLSENIL